MFGLSIVSKKEIQQLKETVTTYSRTLEDIGWINLSLESNSQNQLFSEGFKKMLKTCKIYYYKNPLAGHWVHLTTEFVFGEGVSVPKAKDKKIQEIVDKFWKDSDNQRALTSFSAQHLLNNKLQYEGNLFFALFTDDEGNVRVRIFNTEEIADVINDADDRMRPRFYKVGVRDKRYNFMSDSYDISFQKYIYYPDKDNFNVEDYNIPEEKIGKGAVIFHVKINCDINDKFGIPELYRGIDWIRAHRDMAGDLATLIKSLSTLAWKKKVKGTPAQVTALKSALNSKIDMTNRTVAAGSVQYENEGIDTEPINTPTGGVKIGTDGLRQMKLMVCSASGIFEHYFGDPSTGNLATATSMELPMLKKFIIYQKLWEAIINEILQYQINQKIDAGLLEGSVDYDEKTSRKIYETSLDRLIDIDFPPILEKDLKAIGEALDVARRNNLISDESASRMFLLAANLNNIDEEIKKIDFTRQLSFQSAGIFGQQLPNGQDKPKEGIPKKEDAPIKEAIYTPKHEPGLRFARKTNYVLQRMNGYRKALATSFTDFKKNIKESTKSAGPKGVVVGNIVDLDEHLAGLKKSMIKAAESYFPVAIDIGKKFLQSHLKEQKVKESLFEAANKEISLLDEKLSWNDEYVSTSLIPDIKNKVMQVVRTSYDSEEEFNKAVNAAINSFESRVEQYAGAFWHVEESAVKEAGVGTGLRVNFVGADDESTCDGCNKSMEGNPYLIDEAPEPGSHECDGRCRHALQIIEEG
ncbi:MAG: hypothetical protein HY761_09975 [Candidatus Omnitrophica bacterium]|nr:hypothetical protein [Candidatus Omnitrophota bacterium]